MKEYNEYNDYLVPLSVAKALKQANIDIYSPECFIINDNQNENSIADAWSGLIGDDYTFYAYRPTLLSLIKFFTNYHLYITINQEFYETGINYLWQIFEYDPQIKNARYIDHITDNSTGLYGDNHEYPTYEEALIDAVLKAIEMIVEHKWEILRPDIIGRSGYKN